MLYRQGLTSIGSPGTASRCAVRTSIPPRLRLTTQDAELVAQHENLELLAIGRAAEQDQEPEGRRSPMYRNESTRHLR